MKPLIIFHDHCTDGFGAAFAAWMKFKDEAEYLPMSYGGGTTVANLNSLFPSLRDHEIYILDFSLPKTEMDWLFANAKKVIWLDHHKTSFEMWCGKYEKGMIHNAYVLDPNDVTKESTIVLDDNKSGAMIAWEQFHGTDDVPMLIKHIDDRDRWQFKLEGSKEFHAALASYKPWSFEQWKELNTQLNNWDDIVGPHYVFKEGSAILRAHEQNVKSIVGAGKRDCRIEFNERMVQSDDQPEDIRVYEFRTGLSANCTPHLASDVGHELANESGTFGLCWYVGRDGKAKISLRSNGDYDVSAIAKSFGGGGHQNAAGFEVEVSTLMGWMK